MPAIAQQMTTSRSRNDVLDAVRRLPRILSGKEPDPTGTVEDMLDDLGRTALDLIYKSFLHKSAGGVDAAGIFWPPLKPETVAYKREHAGLVRKHAGERPRGILDAKQDKRWGQVFAYTYRWLLGQGLTMKEAAGSAAAHAWVVVKAEGGKTIIDVYGSRQVPILIDHGDLAESLKPDSGHPEQIFDVGAGYVRVGSSLPYAEAHQKGNPGKNLPKRQLWPETGATLPAEWDQAFQEVIDKWTGVLLEKLLA